MLMNINQCHWNHGDGSKLHEVRKIRGTFTHATQYRNPLWRRFHWNAVWSNTSHAMQSLNEPLPLVASPPSFPSASYRGTTQKGAKTILSPRRRSQDLHSLPSGKRYQRFSSETLSGSTRPLSTSGPFRQGPLTSPPAPSLLSQSDRLLINKKGSGRIVACVLIFEGESCPSRQNLLHRIG